MRDFIKYMAGGATPKISEYQKYYSDSENGVPFLRVQNLSAEGLNWSDCKYINKKTHNSLLKRSQVTGGDLLIKITGVGRMAITSIAPAGFEGNINQHMVVVKTKNCDVNKQIATFLNSDIGEMLATRRSTGGTRPALDYSALRSIPIILNENIVSIMEKAYAEKVKKEKEAQVLLENIEKYLLQELGIPLPMEKENTLKSRIFYVNSGKVSGTRFDPYYQEPGFTDNLNGITNGKFTTVSLRSIVKGELVKGILPNETEKDGENKIVQIGNINNDGTIDLSNNITAKSIYSSKHKLVKGDVLVVVTGATIGKIGFWNCDEEYYLGGDIVKFNTGNYYINEIYAALLRTQPYQLQIKRCITGATNGHLSLFDIGQLPMPNISDKIIQERIANKLECTRISIDALRNDGYDILHNAKKQVEKILLGGNL